MGSCAIAEPRSKCPLGPELDFEFASTRARLRLVPTMGQAQYFGISRGSNLVDAGMAGDHATCYGVNLAVAGLGVGFRAWVMS